ncbi:UDP-N-acetylmuramate dehydrogenase [Candidatus Cardinium hertigii]|uniref:UDP-N-acetylenolpyruvoylglucosamine reductase n=1 Tax=Candidatus Cardinium hertigii TaxID=247481 RepID=A0A2Z3L8R9_9BACT|nr:UDP-N-acetylmuramate dehydrogenase [Candidatus Cardinium hertigii]AWN81797.1 UDP-N-acetylenolpyruvoylglucosamine reductase [Candidatus Cardinium hertigii]
MQLFNHYSLKLLNTFQIPSVAMHYVPCYTVQEIETFCTTIKIAKTGLHILGGGSNTLFVGDYPGYVLHVRLTGIEVIKETSHTILVKAAAGVSWHELVLYCVTRNYGGIENLSFIPGTVGGAIVQNIGAYGVELKEVIDRVEAIELATGKKRIFQSSACAFGYRTSIFNTIARHAYVITAAVLALHKEAKFRITYGAIQDSLAQRGIQQLSFQAISDTIIAIRKQKLPDPAVLGNAGSFFKNPVLPIAHYQSLKRKYPELVAYDTQQEGCIKISAASLITLAGFKGIRKRQVGVYPLHALILVNYGGATGKEIVKLATQIKQKVEKLFHVRLLPEVQIVGEKTML